MNHFEQAQAGNSVLDTFEQERRAFWTAAYAAAIVAKFGDPRQKANTALNEFDSRFPFRGWND